MTVTLRTFVRRGGLFILASFIAVMMVLSPMMTRTANAQLGDLLGLGGSITNGLSSCAIETVGWIICPTMRSIAKLADYGWTYVNSNFLRVDSNISNTGSGTYKAWELMRSVANALFVVAFMILVYSQLTGRNSGGYNIKRLLPRLIIAAIAVNLSYYLCAIIIEFTNILGDSLIQIFKEVASRVGRTIMPIETKPAAFQDGTLTVITTSIMSKTGTAWVLLAPVAAVVITVATITGAALILLIMRKAVIAMLVLASPILFVAYLLPNLERFFFQGVRLFFQLLLLFPIIAILLGAGQIVSATIVTVGSNDANYRVTGDSYFSRNGGSGSAITDLTASAAAVLPLLGVWFVFKNMSSVMSTAGARLQASVASRRGGKEEEAKVTGKATLGAASAKTPSALGNFMGRKQPFNRNRRRSTLAGSALTAENMSNARRQQSPQAEQAALDASIRGKSEDMQAQLAAQQAAQMDAQMNAQLNADGEQKGMGDKLATAVLGAKGRDKDDKKEVTAKDLFNELNKDRMGHASKDKQRQFSAGPAPAGGGEGGGASGGGAQPSAPVASYRAPQIAQTGNIVSGTSAGGTPANIVAVPVQIDASALLGQNNSATSGSPNSMTQMPVSGTEEKAKARAQKYLFDAQRDVDEAQEKLDVLAHGQTGQPKLTEQPHVPVEDDKKDKKE